MNYLELLKHSYEVEKSHGGCPPKSPLEYLGQSIFDFTTYDGEMSVLFARKAVEVCDAINNSKTFDYIKDAENYRWYLLMCNTSFFADKLEWGTSIRGAWWNQEITFQSCGLWKGDEQLADDMNFTQEEWKRFTMAISDFANAEFRNAASGAPGLDGGVQ
jgi:hypothetical protein